MGQVTKACHPDAAPRERDLSSVYLQKGGIPVPQGGIGMTVFTQSPSSAFFEALNHAPQ